MALEIERKFLVIGNDWRKLGTGESYRQGYLPTQPGCTVRVRLVGKQAYLTLKSKTTGIARLEFEYPIPTEDANMILEHLCPPPLIEKTRYKIPQGDLIWEIDEFWGENEGLILAEVELRQEDQEIIIPPWIGLEVTGDRRYYNANLVTYPYCLWSHTN